MSFILNTIFLGVKDILVTPLYFAAFSILLYFYSKKIKDKVERKYFLLGANLRMVGGIAFGLVYEFIYYGGDTSAYWLFGTMITDIFLDNPIIGIRLFTNLGDYSADLIPYIYQIRWYHAPTEFLICLISGFLGIFSFKIYSVITLFFSIFSFSGSWLTYRVLVKIYPQIKKQLLLATLFIPSVVFWGGGMMKDSVCIGALGWLFWAFHTGLIEKSKIVKPLILGVIGFYIIYIVKVYILLAFLPPALFWIMNENSAKLKDPIARAIIKPLFLLIGGFAAFFAATNLTEGNKQYDVDNIAERTKINSEWLYYVSTTQGGSAYSIGEFDGSINSMIKVLPQAINVALFRPYIFEVRNPVMLISALEASFFLFITLQIIFKTGLLKFFRLIFTIPILTFCIVFSLILGAAVGMNSFNFGTLVRYKIPIMPFYLSALYILRLYATNAVSVNGIKIRLKSARMRA